MKLPVRLILGIAAFLLVCAVSAQTSEHGAHPVAPPSSAPLASAPDGGDAGTVDAPPDRFPVAPAARAAVPLSAYLTVAASLFTIGVIGVIVKRNPIVIFMCIELMLNSVNLTFLAFARYHPGNSAAGVTQHVAQVGGQMNVIFVMAVAAAEVAVGLGIIMAIFRLRDNINVDEMNLLRG